MARAGGTAGGGMGGGPDSAPGGSSAAGPGTAGPGNAPGQGMGADAFGGGGDPSQQTAKEFKEALQRAINKAVEKNKEFKAQQAPATNPAYDPQEVEAQVMGTRQRSPSVDLNQVESNVPFDAGAEDDPDSIGRAMQEKGAFLDDREAMAGAASPSMSALGMDGMQGMQGALTGASTLDDPQGTEKGLAQEQAAVDALDARSALPSAHPSRDPSIASTAIETNFANNPQAKAAAYDSLNRELRNMIDKGTITGKALSFLEYAIKNFGVFGQFSGYLDKALQMAGFSTDTTIGPVGRAIRAGQEVATQGARGAGGVSVGSRNDGIVQSMLESGQLNYVEPWMKGLSDQQIQYYFDRPSELEWVRTTWSKAFGMPSKYIQE